ncbi:MAG: 5-bromo-4-chloroindolyl phosphate hydrolysis family protein [Oscillospiraceae bacterium]|nr:5-bromo-4-chloroindolyl phosphate hydrolysis family protein [Oscillospiraceae bacterium]
MAEKIKRSPAPPYLVALIWLLYGLLFRAIILTGGGILVMIVLSLFVWWVASKIWPKKTMLSENQKAQEQKAQAQAQAQAQPQSHVHKVEAEQKAEKHKTRQEKKEAKAEAKAKAEAEAVKLPPKDPEIAAMIKEEERAITEMRRLNQNISDPKLSLQIDDLESTSRKIFDHVTQHPEKLPQIRRFMNYYVPTTIKLLNAYDRMDNQGIEGENIDTTKDKIEKVMDTVVVAYHKQLDSLFSAEALDISTDITVMENLLAQEGLTEKAFDQPLEQAEIPTLEIPGV